MKKGERIIAIVLIMFCGLYFYLSRNFLPESKFFPRIMIISLFILSVTLLLNTYRRGKKLQSTEIQNKIILPRLFGAIAISFIYMSLIQIIGFYVMTALFLLIIMYFLGIKNLNILLTVPIISTLFLYVGFRIFLQIPTPRGIFF